MRGAPSGDVFCLNLCCVFHFVVVLSSLRPEWYFTDVHAILNTLSDRFVSVLEQGGCRCFSNPSKENHNFQGFRVSIFQCFLQYFPDSIPDFIFIVPLVVLGSPRFPFWRVDKRVCECLRVYASIGGYWGGVPFKQDNRFLQKQLFNISSLQRCLKARWRIRKMLTYP